MQRLILAMMIMMMAVRMIATVNVVVVIILCMLVLPCGKFLCLRISLMFVLICLLVESLLGYGFCCISASKILSDAIHWPSTYIASTSPLLPGGHRVSTGGSSTAPPAARIILSPTAICLLAWWDPSDDLSSAMAFLMYFLHCLWCVDSAMS